MTLQQMLRKAEATARFDSPAEAAEAGAAQAIKAPKVPPRPSQELVDAHILGGHAVYAAWCEDCIAGHGREDPHRRSTGDER